MSPRSKSSRKLIGVNAWGHDVGVCVMDPAIGAESAELILKERVTRRKNADGSPLPLLSALRDRVDLRSAKVGMSSVFLPPPHYHLLLSKRLPQYAEKFRRQRLRAFDPLGNREMRFLTHHLCHASAAAELSPFRKSLIVVVDGAGSCVSAFASGHAETTGFQAPADPRASEWFTAYIHDGGRLECIHKEWQVFEKGFPSRAGAVCGGLGIFYETAAKYIFNSTREAGKVMGLAPYGRARAIHDRVEYLRGLDWSKAFRGGGKAAWERSSHQKLYRDVAASVQAHFEEQLFERLRALRLRAGSDVNLILTGGCALNCTANTKLLNDGLFRSVYIPPFPSDESIAFGIAAWLMREEGAVWAPVPFTRQRANFGPASSEPAEAATRRLFRGHDILKPSNIARAAAIELASGRVLGWYQGRSESGPRALGFRSILASPLVEGIKDRLNGDIKGRESFRPFGASLPHSEASRYLEVPKSFECPFMSFAPRVRKAWRKRLGEVTHADGTCRVQTVHRSQNPLFHELLREFGRISEVPVVLNTSLNIMGEPIVETLEDAARFFEKTPVDAMVVGELLIRRKAKGHRAARAAPSRKP